VVVTPLNSEWDNTSDEDTNRHRPNGGYTTSPATSFEEQQQCFEQQQQQEAHQYMPAYQPIPAFPTSAVASIIDPQLPAPPSYHSPLLASSSSSPVAAATVTFITASASAWYGVGAPVGAAAAAAAQDHLLSPRVTDHHSIMDQAVEELFLHEASSLAERDSILDFVNGWENPFVEASGSDADALTDDAQLGNLLDKLLQDC
jgi:hypothetical protein